MPCVSPTETFSFFVNTDLRFGAGEASRLAEHLGQRGWRRLALVVDGGIAARDDDLGAIAQLTGQPAELGHGSRELGVLHRARRVDHEPRPRPRLVERRHDELAVARLPSMRPPVGPVVPADGAVAQGLAHDVADGREVVHLRLQDP